MGGTLFRVITKKCKHCGAEMPAQHMHCGSCDKWQREFYWWEVVTSKVIRLCFFGFIPVVGGLLFIWALRNRHAIITSLAMVPDVFWVIGLWVGGGLFAVLVLLLLLNWAEQNEILGWILLPPVVLGGLWILVALIKFFWQHS